MCTLLFLKTCCCGKYKSDEDEIYKKTIDERSVSCEQLSTYDIKTESHASDLEKCGSGTDLNCDISNAATVKDIINAIEKSSSEKDCMLRDKSKHQKRMPKSKAFEEFERSGILIGYGKAQKKTTKGYAEDSQSEEMESGYGQSSMDCSYTRSESGDSFLSGFSHNSLSSHSSGDLIEKRKHGDRNYEKVQTNMDNKGKSKSLDENLSEEIPRETEILTSFRKPPPPKHRSKSRNSVRLMTKSMETSENDFPDLRDQTSSPIYSITEEAQFEEMLRMPTLQPSKAHSLHHIPSIKYDLDTKESERNMENIQHRNTFNNFFELDIMGDIPVRTKSDCSNRRSIESRKTVCCDSQDLFFHTPQTSYNEKRKLKTIDTNSKNLKIGISK